MSENTPLGFVVIGRNEGARLIECLESLAPFDAPIVYADSASTDGSVEKAASLGALICELDPETPMNAGRGRAEGVDHLLAAHPSLEFVQFLDGDCLLQPAWLETAVAFMRAHPDVAAACGLRFERDPEASIYNRVCDEEWQTPVGQAEACGGDAIMRVRAYRQVGGFRSDLMAGEEPELCARLRASGWSIWRLDARMTQHDARILRFGQWLRRAMRSGFGYAQVWAATKALPKRLYGRQMLSALLWGIAMPVGVLLLALIGRSPVLLLLIPAAFLAQTTRIALGRHVKDGFSWKRAALLMASKQAEAIGVVRYALGRQRNSTIEYKGH